MQYNKKLNKTEEKKRWKKKTISEGTAITLYKEKKTNISFNNEY